MLISETKLIGSKVTISDNEDNFVESFYVYGDMNVTALKEWFTSGSATQPKPKRHYRKRQTQTEAVTA